MRILFLILFVFVVPASFASSAVGVVSQIRASESTDLIIFKIDGEVLDSPRCNESSTYTFQLSSPGGRAVLELLKISMMEKMIVKVVGLNTCSRGFQSESVHDITIG